MLESIISSYVIVGVNDDGTQYILRADYKPLLFSSLQSAEEFCDTCNLDESFVIQESHLTLVQAQKEDDEEEIVDFDEMEGKQQEVMLVVARHSVGPDLYVQKFRRKKGTKWTKNINKAQHFRNPHLVFSMLFGKDDKQSFKIGKEEYDYPCYVSLASLVKEYVLCAPNVNEDLCDLYVAAKQHHVKKGTPWTTDPSKAKVFTQKQKDDYDLCEYDSSIDDNGLFNPGAAFGKNYHRPVFRPFFRPLMVNKEED